MIKGDVTPFNILTQATTWILINAKIYYDLNQVHHLLLLLFHLLYLC